VRALLPNYFVCMVKWSVLRNFFLYSILVVTDLLEHITSHTLTVRSPKSTLDLGCQVGSHLNLTCSTFYFFYCKFLQQNFKLKKIKYTKSKIPQGSHLYTF
jgi:hypothetical protein